MRLSRRSLSPLLLLAVLPAVVAACSESSDTPAPRSTDGGSGTGGDAAGGASSSGGTTSGGGDAGLTIDFDGAACGLTNDESPTLAVNEVQSAGDDYVELYNAGDSAIDLSDVAVTDADGDDCPKLEGDEAILTSGTMLAPGELFVVATGGATCDGIDVACVDSAAFGISAGSGDSIFVVAGTTLLAHVAVPADIAEGSSYCRMPDGTGAYGTCEASIGELNGGGGMGAGGAGTGGSGAGGAGAGGDGAGGDGGSSSVDIDFGDLDVTTCADYSVGAPLEGLVVNELATSNDFVELHNAGSTALDLSGLVLTDGNLDCPRDNDPLTFPADTELAPGEYLVITLGLTCPTGVTCIDGAFGMSGGDGDNVFLLSGSEIIGYATAPGGLAETASSCRLPNANGDFTTCETPTPGAANSSASGGGSVTVDFGGFDFGACSSFTATASSALSINEVTTSDDYVELVNLGTEAFDLSGLSIADGNNDCPRTGTGEAYTFPLDTTIAPGERLVVVMNGDSCADLSLTDDCVDGPLPGFSGKDGDHVFILAGSEVIAFAAVPGDLAQGESYCRVDDGAGDYATCVSTPGAANTEN